MVKIGFDVDGVLANFYGAVCQRYNKPLSYITEWDVPWIGEIYGEVAQEEEFWGTLPLLTDPKEIDFHVTCYITSLPPEMLPIRKKWLEKNGFPNAPVICADDKLKAIKEYDLDFFVDDKPSTIIQILNDEHKCKPLHFVPMYFRPNMITASQMVISMDDIKFKINNYKI